MLPVHLCAGFVDDADVETRIVGPWIATELSRHLDAVVNRSFDSRKLQAASMPRWNAIFHIEKISSHE